MWMALTILGCLFGGLTWKGDFETCTAICKMQCLLEIGLINSVRNSSYSWKTWSFSIGLRMYQWRGHKKDLVPFKNRSEPPCQYIKPGDAKGMERHAKHPCLKSQPATKPSGYPWNIMKPDHMKMTFTPPGLPLKLKNKTLTRLYSN